MYSTKFSFLRNLGIGLLTLLVTLPLTYAQRQQQFDRGDSGLRNEPNQRSEPARAPMERTPVIVDRPNHGSVRHVDTQAIEHPVEMHRPAVAPSPADVRRNVEIRHEADIRQHVLVHRDVEVDLNRSHFWHGFVFGARFHDLRAGWLRLFVNNSAYFYDDGIYYQHIGDGYQEVYPPVGAVITELPDGATEINDGNQVYYYAGGAFYVQQNGGFVVVPAPIGVIVPELPPGVVELSAGNGVLYQFNDIYLQPVFVHGVTQYRTLRH